MGTHHVSILLDQLHNVQPHLCWSSIKGKNKKVTQQEHTKAEEDMDQRFLWFKGHIINVVDVFYLTRRKNDIS